MITSKCSWNHFISKKYKTVQSFELHFFKIVPLCNYILIPVTVNVLETFLEAILWKPSQLFIAFLMMSVAPQCSYQSREKVKISCNQVRREWGMLQCCHTFFSMKSMTKTDWCAGALPWMRSQLLVLHFSVHQTASLRLQRMSMYNSLFTAAIPVNYISVLWELFKASTHNVTTKNSLQH
jgi:hypothetical protein